MLSNTLMPTKRQSINEHGTSAKLMGSTNKLLFN